MGRAEINSKVWYILPEKIINPPPNMDEYSHKVRLIYLLIVGYQDTQVQISVATVKVIAGKLFSHTRTSLLNV